MAFEGQAVARLDGHVVFVDYAIPGEKVRARLERKKGNVWFGRAVEIIEPSTERVEPRCPYFGECGGCQWQHIDYAAQTRLKTEIVRDQLRKIGKFTDAPILDTIPSPAPWYYRNNIRLAVTPKAGLAFARRRSNTPVVIEECVVSEPGINRRLARLQGNARGSHVSLRSSQVTGETLVEIQGLEGEASEQAYHEELAGRRFRISADSFFQVNTHTAEIIVRELQQRLTLGDTDRLLDVYAGVGTFAALFGAGVREVVAVEESRSAVRDAMFNTLHLTNVEYIHGRAEDVLPSLKPGFDAVIVNPPRAGLKTEVAEWLLANPADRLAYVSCDPATLARDLRLLVDGGYSLLDIQPIDQFPQTYHVECVAGLRWK